MRRYAYVFAHCSRHPEPIRHPDERKDLWSTASGVTHEIPFNFALDEWFGAVHVVSTSTPYDIERHEWSAFPVRVGA